MPNRLELEGMQYGKLTVLRRNGQDKHRAWMWECQCDCGKSVVVRGSTLSAGRTKSCSSCASSASSTTHGQTGTLLYQRWRAMISRSEYPSHREFANYGGRGIKVSPEWHEFSAFARDMGPGFDPDLELDRIDVDGDYAPENCRWATRVEQQNNRRNNHRILWRGTTRTVKQWADLLGLKPNTLLYRLRRGWDLDRAMTFRVPKAVLLALSNGGDDRG